VAFNLPQNTGSVTALQQLISDAQSCSLCPRMASSRRVLSLLNGDWHASVMFVAEAPGRLGAEVTGIPLFGDRSGDRFEELLNAIGWSRSQVFITNAVLCNPRGEDGNNDLPRMAEIRNCSTFLHRTITLVNPALVIALGRVALNALRSVHPHNLKLKEAAGKVRPWGERHLAVLYHPGPRTQVHRKWEQQLRDAKAIAAFAERELRITPSVKEEKSLLCQNFDCSVAFVD
jgi:uracil-DNA glycosylase family 4